MTTLRAPSLSLDSRGEVLCTHCDQVVPDGLVRDDAPDQFCCHGCETAYGVIHSCGLERYYALVDAAGEKTGPAKSTGRAYAEFDDPAFHTLYVRKSGEGVRSTELFLEGVHCSACVWLVERLPRVVPGVLEARLDVRRAIVRVRWDSSRVALSQVAKGIDALGYASFPARDAGSRSRRQAEDRRRLIHLAVSGACAGNVMLLALALYAGLFDAMDPVHASLFRWTSMAISLVALLWPGAAFFRSAWGALRVRSLHLDVPIALALAAGAVWSIWTTVRGHGEIYFDSLSVLVFALLAGRFVQQRQQRWSADSVELLFSLTPTAARRVEGDTVREVPVEALAAGDLVEIRAGDSCPADGVVIQGRSALDQSLLTGESRPEAVGEGSAVAAGCVNISGTIRVRVEATGEQTRVGRLMRLVEECSQRRAPIVQFADRMSGWFVAGMLGLATITLAYWLWRDSSKAVDHAVALLVVTCPCALGLGTPLAITAALGRAARAGMLIKGGEVIQRLSRPGVVFLDKTGTITGGRMEVVRWFGDESARPLAAALESQSNHPIAKAIASHAVGEHAVRDARQTVGAGIEGLVDGRRVLVGSAAFVRSRVESSEVDLSSALAECIRQGLTPILLSIDDRVVAVAGLGDRVRKDSIAAIRELRSSGWSVKVLSGDHPDIVRAVASEVGISSEDARGGLSPEDKVALVREAGSLGTVVMVGDGVNDAAALAAASVGVAVHGGAEASLAAADVYLNRPGLSGLVDLIDGSRRTMRVIKRNLAVSSLYNLSAGAAAVFGLVGPLLAAVVMPISSLTVTALSFRSRSFGGRP
ncbi:H+-transporting ATPase [Phycisphaerales bacterium]|nr:H+-transporting ATPase [Phycisphaerales bacterium]